MEALSEREMQVLELTAWDCLSAKEIGDKLDISPMTAQNHLRNIKCKLGLQKITELCKHYYVNIYASILLLIVLPGMITPSANVWRFRSRQRFTTTRVIARRNEIELTTI